MLFLNNKKAENEAKNWAHEKMQNHCIKVAASRISDRFSVTIAVTKIKEVFVLRSKRLQIMNEVNAKKSKPNIPWNQVVVILPKKRCRKGGCRYRPKDTSQALSDCQKIVCKESCE